MNIVTTDISKKQKSTVNPFTKLAADKKKISDAIISGKALSTVKGVKFVAPI